jgi:integrase
MATIAKRRGRYVLDFYDCRGRRQRQTCKEGTTLKKAKEALRQIEDQLESGVYIGEDKVPIFPQVAEAWLAFKKPNLRASTWEVYEGHTRKHFPEFASIKMNRITAPMIEKFIMERQAARMPINTIRKIIVSLNQIFKYAARHGYIHQNPMLLAERPREPQDHESQSIKNIRVLNPSEISTFLAAEKNQKYRTMFMLAIMSGLRQGELIGLKWSDVDWRASQITVERTFNNQAWYQPKTKGSRRRIDLGPAMLRELKMWRLACPSNELDLVFPNEAGGPINHNNLVVRHFRPSMKSAGIEKIRWHDLRHTYASLLVEQGENIKYIQSQLGHSSPTVTLNVYAHLMKPTNQEAALRLEGTIFGTGHNLVTTNEKGASVLTVTP